MSPVTELDKFCSKLAENIFRSPFPFAPGASGSIHTGSISISKILFKEFTKEIPVRNLCGLSPLGN